MATFWAGRHIQCLAFEWNRVYDENVEEAMPVARELHLVAVWYYCAISPL
jgi:hypothetical protein